MKTLASALMIGALALFAGQTQAEQEVFTWVDGDGTVHYSDRPMVPNAKATGLVYSNTDPEKLREQQMRAWEIQQQEAARSSEQAQETERDRMTQAERARQRELGCQAARKRMESYTTAPRLYEELPGSERRYLSSAEIDEAREQSLQDVEDWCN